MCDSVSGGLREEGVYLLVSDAAWRPGCMRLGPESSTGAWAVSVVPGTRHITAVLCQQHLPGLSVCEGSTTLRPQPLFYNSYNLDLVQCSVVNKLSHVLGEWRAFSEDVSFALYLKIKILLRKLRGHTKLCRLLHEYFPVTSSVIPHFGRCSFFRRFENWVLL